MEQKVDIGFDEHLQAIKQLPDDQLSVLKSELNSNKGTSNMKTAVNDNKNLSNMDELRALLLKGPVFTKEQLKDIADARNTSTNGGQNNPFRYIYLD